MRWNLIFAAVLFVILVFLLIETLGYPTKAKAFPLIAIVAALLLLSSEILRQAFALKRKKEAAKSEGGGELRRKYLAVGMWMSLTLVILWFLGFMATVILLPFLYLRRQGESWLLSIGLALGSGIFFYVLFAWALRMPLYQGLLLLKILG